MQQPLSKIQEQFWVLGNLYPSALAYNIPLVYKISGELCVRSFKEAIANVLKVHTLLSASIHVNNNSPYFNIPSTFNIDDYFNAQFLQIKSSNEAFKEYILNDIHRSFKLIGDFLLRVRYVSFADSQYIVFLFHHIIIDHYSKHIFLSDISKYYSSSINKTNIKINSPINEYKSYVKYERDWLSSEKANKMKMEWKSEFQNSLNQIDLPFDKNDEMTFKAQGKRIQFRLYEEVSNKIDKFSSEYHIDPFVFLLSAYTLFLSRIGEQTSFAIGVPLSNRRNEDFKETVGCFVNILPLIIRLDKNITFLEIIKQVRNELLKNHRRQEIPFLELQSLYNENQKGYPFRVGFTFEGPVDFFLENIVVKPEIIERKGAQLELFLTLWPSGSGYQGFMEFNTDKFNDVTIHRFIDTYKTIIQEVLISPINQYLDYNIISGPDKRFIETINNTKCFYNKTLCVH